MFNEVVTDTNIMYYLMMAVGAIGVLAKAVNQITLRRFVRAAGNMSKSTHKLIKLVRAKYEHSLMLHDRVENVGVFVEKYIYEYRGFLLRIHTWRQLELQSIWFSGILAVFAGAVWYMEKGFCEEVYRYIALGAAEMVLLFVVSQLSDEQYKIEAGKNYMVDYLENVCAMRRRKARQSEKSQIDIIQADSTQASQSVLANGNGMEAEGSGITGNGAARIESAGTTAARDGTAGNEAAGNAVVRNGAAGNEATGNAVVRNGVAGNEAAGNAMARDGTAGNEAAGNAAVRDGTAGNVAVRNGATGNESARSGVTDWKVVSAESKEPSKPGLSINIEGEPRSLKTDVPDDTAPMYETAEELAFVTEKYEEIERNHGAATGYATAARGEVNASGRAEGGTQMKRIPGRFQDVVQRMIEDASDYEEVLDSSALRDESSHLAGQPDMAGPKGGNLSDRLRQAAEYLESGGYGEEYEEAFSEYERARRKGRKKGEATRQVIHRTMKGNPAASEREESTVKEEAIRQILEEFLA